MIRVTETYPSWTTWREAMSERYHPEWSGKGCQRLGGRYAANVLTFWDERTPSPPRDDIDFAFVRVPRTRRTPEQVRADYERWPF